MENKVKTIVTLMVVIAAICMAYEDERQLAILIGVLHILFNQAAVK
jgi:hypothetical protein